MSLNLGKKDLVFSQCDTKSGYDPLIELPSGHERLVALGYERPQRGPTTNFVGNHMTQVQTTLGSPGAFHGRCSIQFTNTFFGKRVGGNPQGAIDLVQMELKRPGPLKELRDLGWYRKNASGRSQMPAMLAIGEEVSNWYKMAHTLNTFAHTNIHSSCLSKAI